MSWRHEILQRIRAVLRRTRFEDEMDEELRFHLESMIQDNTRAGMPPQEARRIALLSFGGLDITKEECRDTRWAKFADDIWRDLRYGTRLLIKNRGYTIVAVLALSLGIGANTAVFSVVQGVLLRPLPYEKSGELVVFTNDTGHLDSIAPPYYRGLRERSRVFQEIAIFDQVETHLTDSGEPEILKRANVSASFFDILHVRPSFGRVFTQEEDRPGSARTVVLGYGLWRRRFGGDPGILGRAVRLSDKLYTVIGVMPLGFAFPNDDTGVWVPFNVEYQDLYGQPSARLFSTIARLKTGVAPALAEEAVNKDLARLSNEYPDYRHETRVHIAMLHAYIVGEVRPALLVLLVAVSLVLLIACANVANLTLIRAEGRRKEMAIRVSLGASRRDLIRQSLAESFLVSSVGCGVGLLLSRTLVGPMIRLAPRTIPRLDQIGLNAPVLLFTVAAAIFTTLASGLFPALKSSNPDFSDTMKEGGSRSSAETGRCSVRNLLVICQLTLAVILLIGAGLMLKTCMRLFRLDLGFDPQGVLTMRLQLPYRENAYQNRNQRMAFLKETCNRLESLPGVESVALTYPLPLSWSGIGTFTIDRQKDSKRGDCYWADLCRVSPRYFQTMRIPILRGRPFTESDDAQLFPVLIVDQTMARTVWPGLDDPIGNQLRNGDGGPLYTVVGVVANVRTRPLGSPPEGWESATGQAYFLVSQDHISDTLVIRTRVAPLTLIDTIRREIWTLDKNQAVSEVSTMEKRVNEFTALPRFYMALLAGFAILATVLGATGVYAVIAYSVAMQTHEIGIRMALGADRRDVFRMVFGRGAALVLTGLAMGLVGACLLNRSLTSLVYEVQPNDPAAFMAVSILFALVSLVACCMPARAATRVDPMVALRYE